jgi:hypothetical protein
MSNLAFDLRQAGEQEQARDLSLLTLTMATQIGKTS